MRDWDSNSSPTPRLLKWITFFRFHWPYSITREDIMKRQKWREVGWIPAGKEIKGKIGNFL
jgi:hypothetical protein